MSGLDQNSFSMEFEEGEVDDVSDSDQEVFSDCNDDATNRGNFDKTNSRERCDAFVYCSSTQKYLNPPKFETSLTKCVSNEDPVDLLAYEKTPKHLRGNQKRKKKKRPDLKKKILRRTSRPKTGNVFHKREVKKKEELCKFYAVGVCSKDSCLFMHSEFPCKFFHVTNDCFHGDNCKYSHAPLTVLTRSLLDKLPTKVSTDCKTSGRQLDFKYSGDEVVDHGDADYRFVQRPPAREHEGPSRNIHPPRISAPNLFSPVYPRGGVHSFRGEYGPTRPRYPSSFRSVDPPPRHFSHAANTQYAVPNYPPQHLSNPLPPMVPNGSNNYRHTSVNDVHLRAPSRMPSHMRMKDPNHPRFARFRPRLELSGVNGAPPRYNNALHFKEEALVNSELDKMAAMLASRKSTTDITAQVSPSTEVELKSPHQVNLPLTNQDETSGTFKSPPNDQSNAISLENLQINRSVTIEDMLNLHPQILPSNPIPWRLIPLDMSVKVPYPLMQLPVNDMPHRFDDPRLRGQLTTLRPHIYPTTTTSSLENNVDTQSEIPESQDNTTAIDIKPSDHVSDASVTQPVQRRPVKLQLNEMANTFASTTTASSSDLMSARPGDRSYLDDPRFRRRRILSGASANGLTSDSTQNSAKPGYSNSPQPTSNVMT